VKNYSPKSARHDLAWLQDTRTIRSWSPLDDDPTRFSVVTFDGREHVLDLAEVRSFWRGVLSGWRAARRASAELLSVEVPS
jgi:hypothetical protein